MLTGQFGITACEVGLADPSVEKWGGGLGFEGLRGSFENLIKSLQLQPVKDNAGRSVFGLRHDGEPGQRDGEENLGSRCEEEGFC